MKYIIGCPECGGCEVQQIDSNEFVCDDCGEEFELDDALVVPK